MSFEPNQHLSKLKVVNKFADQIKFTLDKAWVALSKSKDDMVRYYNQ